MSSIASSPMDEKLTKFDTGNLTSIDPRLQAAGQAANQAAAANVFEDYRSRKAANTLRRQDADLALFTEFIRSTGAGVGDLVGDPAAWVGITWGLVAAWQRWQLAQGYAVGSINVRLSTVKKYATLAMKAGFLSAQECAMIRTVEGYSHKEVKRIDDQRKDAGLDTRKGAKKRDPVSLTPDQASALKRQPDTPQGRRDALLMCLMLDLGLRVGEVAGLTVDCFDLEAGELRFYRPKVHKTQTHRLTADTLQAARAYLSQDAPALGSIWRASANKGDGKEAYQAGELTGQGMSTRAITDRVGALGELVGVEGLSAHDLRHFWATKAARNGTTIDRLQQAGGWSSPAMPLRYVEAARIANAGVKLE
jgi:integrase